MMLLSKKHCCFFGKAKTPFRRDLEHPLVSEGAKEFLRQLYEKLNPIRLRREIVELKRNLFQLVKEKNRDKISYVSQEEYELKYVQRKVNKEMTHESTS